MLGAAGAYTPVHSQSNMSVKYFGWSKVLSSAAPCTSFEDTGEVYVHLYIPGMYARLPIPIPLGRPEIVKGIMNRHKCLQTSLLHLQFGHALHTSGKYKQGHA